MLFRSTVSKAREDDLLALDFLEILRDGSVGEVGEPKVETNLVDVVGAADGEEHSDDGFVRSAVERAVERCACGGDDRVGVDERRADLKGCCGRCIHLVLQCGRASY